MNRKTKRWYDRNMPEIKLRRCPCCGLDNIATETNPNSDVAIFCEDCKVRTDWEFSLAIALKKWNFRDLDTILKNCETFISYTLRYVDGEDYNEGIQLLNKIREFKNG